MRSGGHKQPVDDRGHDSDELVDRERWFAVQTLGEGLALHFFHSKVGVAQRRLARAEHSFKARV